MKNICNIFLLSILTFVCLFANAQYIRKGRIYVYDSNKYLKYNGCITEQYHYKEKMYINVINCIYTSLLGENSVDSIIVSGNVKNGRENGIFSFYLVDGHLFAIAEMEKGKINGNVTIFYANRKYNYQIKNRKLIKQHH